MQTIIISNAHYPNKENEPAKVGSFSLSLILICAKLCKKVDHSYESYICKAHTQPPAIKSYNNA